MLSNSCKSLCRVCHVWYSHPDFCSEAWAGAGAAAGAELQEQEQEREQRQEQSITLPAVGWSAKLSPRSWPPAEPSHWNIMALESDSSHTIIMLWQHHIIVRQFSNCVHIWIKIIVNWTQSVESPRCLQEAKSWPQAGFDPTGGGAWWWMTSKPAVTGIRETSWRQHNLHWAFRSWSWSSIL